MSNVKTAPVSESTPENPVREAFDRLVPASDVPGAEAAADAVLRGLTIASDDTHEASTVADARRYVQGAAQGRIEACNDSVAIRARAAESLGKAHAKSIVRNAIKSACRDDLRALGLLPTPKASRARATATH